MKGESKQKPGSHDRRLLKSSRAVLIGYGVIYSTTTYLKLTLALKTLIYVIDR